MSPTLISVQVGVPRVVKLDGGEVSTGIFKIPVQKRLQMRALNLDGDRQADLSVHGGRDKAVYAYPSEHYAYWKKELPRTPLPWGSFGENLTTEGLLEDEVFLGDRFTIGTAEVVVTQPRIPCFKLNLKFQRDDMAKRFLASRRTGFYFRVLREGEIGAGDEILRVGQDENRVSISEALKIYLGAPGSSELRERALRVKYLRIPGARNLAGRLDLKHRESISRRSPIISVRRAVVANALPRTLEKRTMRGPQCKKFCGLAALFGTKNILGLAARNTSWRIR